MGERGEEEWEERCYETEGEKKKELIAKFSWKAKTCMSERERSSYSDSK